MKLTPWLRSLRNGISRTFTKAKIKRRNLTALRERITDVGCAEALEDRLVLNARGYFTIFQDGVYDAGHLLQPQPNPPITLPNNPFDGKPAIPIVVTFNGPVTVMNSSGSPRPDI